MKYLDEFKESIESPETFWGEQAQVTLGIYDVLGKQIKTLVNQSQDAGNKIAMWDGTDELGRQVSAGVYLYQIQAGDFSQTRKMVLLK
jgi:flagellar hook assembly protein FlgD